MPKILSGAAGTWPVVGIEGGAFVRRIGEAGGGDRRWSRRAAIAARIALAVILVLLCLPPVPSAAADRGLTVWSPSFMTNEMLTGGVPIEPGAVYEFDVTVTATIDVDDATVAVARTELGVEVIPDVFDLVAYEPQTLRVRLSYPTDFPRRLKRFYLVRLRINGPLGPLGGAFMVRSHIADPEVGYRFLDPPPTELSAGDVWSSQLEITTTRPLTSMVVVRDRTFVSVSKFGTLTRADQSTVPITLTQPIALRPREVASIPVTVAAPLKPRSSLHAATISVLNRGQRMKQRQPLRFRVTPIEVEWAARTINLTMAPGDVREVETEVTLSGRVPEATVRVRTSDIATVMMPDGPIDLEADVPEPITLLVRAPFDPGSYLASVVIGRRGETLSPPLLVYVRVER